MEKIDINFLKTELSRGLKAYKAFEKADEVLTEIAGLDQFVKETEANLKVLKEQEAKSSLVVNAAKEEAEKIVAEAKETASATKKKADDYAAKKEKEADAFIEATLKRVQGESDRLGLQNNELDAVIKAKKEVLEKLNKEISIAEQAKDKILRSLAG